MSASTVTKVTYVDNETVIGAENLNAIQDTINQHATEINKKVDAQEGYGLSQENYSPAEQTKLGALPTNADLTTALNGKVNTSATITTAQIDALFTEGGES